MKYIITIILLSVSLVTTAQSIVYQGFEVDTAATPRGGMPLLNTFIQVNLRKPVAADAEGVGGRVVLAGVVQPDGRITDVSIVRGIRPDLDREAIRVFSLYNAWQPASKDAKPVRQAVTIPITFAKNAPFAYSNGSKAVYYDADSKFTADTTIARYKQLTPIDSAGLPAGDMVVYEKKGKSWRESNRLTLVRNEKVYRISPDKWAHQLGCQNADKKWEGLVVVVNDERQLVKQGYYQNGRLVSDERQYHSNGAVASKREKADDKNIVTNWYATGQIEQVSTTAADHFMPTTPPDQVTALWDSAGVMLVNNGNGLALHQDMVRSLQDTAVYTLFMEKGLYENGFRQGEWMGRYADGSFQYSEQYDKGVCLGGIASRAGETPKPYKVLNQVPTFPGGISGLGQFLSTNIRYPANAQKDGKQGKVVVSFVVCTDGTLCDYEILQGAHPEFEREALRVVKQMSGKWTPGVQRGETVRVKYNLPINFSLN